MQISSDLKRKLKAEAHHLKPVVLIGHRGLTDALVGAVDKALEDHELIKVKFNDLKDEKKQLSTEIEQRTGCALVALTGNVAIYYRENPDKD